MGRVLRAAVNLVVAAMVLAACAPGASDAAGPSTLVTTTPATTAPPPTAPTATTSPPATSPPATTLPPATTAVPPAPTGPRVTAAPPTTAALPDRLLAQAGDAGQVIVVTSPSAGATTATLTGYARGADGWHPVFGPWAARVGARGVAPAGEKREGDGRTPAGVFGFDFLFGVAPDPGVLLPYRRVTSRSIVWDDDPASPLYNTWVDLDRQPGGAGADPEPMYVTPAYDYGAVIAYNSARTPGLGSAIFLHVATGGATAGCVSLPAGQLVEVLRWLDPALAPRIAIGISS